MEWAFMIATQDLRYVLLAGEHGGQEYAQMSASAFRLWREVWTKEFQELKVRDCVHSDDFSRQSRIGCLFLEKRCVALVCFHGVDFSHSTARLDSYFEAWPDEAIAKLRRDGDHVVVGSYVTVDAEFRGKRVLAGDCSIKSLAAGLAVATLLDSPADAMSGTMRCDRGMHTVAHDFGASELQSGVRHYGVEVELVAFYRRELSDRGVVKKYPAVEALWMERMDCGGSWGFRNAN